MNSIEHYNNFMNTFSADERQNILTNCNDLQKNALMALSFGLPLSDSYQEIITNIFSNLNILNRNSVNRDTFSERVINETSRRKRVFKSWTVSECLNFVISGLTQMGKTDSIFDCLLNFLKSGIFSIIVSDTSRAQLNQLEKRLKKRITKEEKNQDQNNQDERDKFSLTIINMDELTTKEFNRRVKDFISRKDHKFVILCINTQCTVVKLKNLFTELIEMETFKYFKQVVKFHDEGDTVVKNENFNVCDDSYTKSHNEWIKFTQLMSKYTILKNIYISATPDTILMKVDIKCEDMLFLEPTTDYVGYKKFNYTIISDTYTEEEKFEEMEIEINRGTAAKTKEVILDTFEHLTAKQEISVEKISNCIKNDKYIVHSYNSDRIVIKTNGMEICKNLYDIFYRDIPAELWDTHYSGYYDFLGYMERNGNKFVLPYECIINNVKQIVLLSDLYDMFQESGADCVVTVGHNMLKRGSSAVAGNRNITNPFTATVLFSKPNEQMYMVALIQAWGRLCGTARPELPRRVYTPQKPKDYFIKHNEKQESDIKDFKKLENNKTFTKDIVTDKIYPEGTSNNIERKNVKLPKINVIVNEEPVESDLLRILNDNRDIKGKIIRYLFDKDEITYEQLLVGIEYQNSGSRSDMEGLISNISNCRNYVTTRLNNDTYYIKLNEQTRTQMQNNPTNF